MGIINFIGTPFGSLPDVVLIVETVRTDHLIGAHLAVTFVPEETLCQLNAWLSCLAGHESGQRGDNLIGR